MKRARIISGATQVVAIIGDPIAHTLSPAMHNAAFAALRLDYVYVAFHVTPAQLRSAVRSLDAFGFAGLNVTVPHKERIVPLLDTATPQARLVGAVNTIYRRRGRWVGENTDVMGFVAAMNDAGYRGLRQTAVVVGAGGAARAVIAGLHARGTRRILVANRSDTRRRALQRYFGRRGIEVSAAPLAALNDRRFLVDANLVVNTTSLGLRGERFPPLAWQITSPDCLFYDLIYGKSTDFLRKARQAGRPTLDGSGMLLRQGAAAFELWTGRQAPLKAMARVLRETT